MKIYMLCALKTDPGTKSKLLELAQYLQTKGHRVNASRVDGAIETKPDYTDNELSSYHKRMMDSIKQCDMVIAEISSKSSGLGYEIAMALNERKPILALFHGAPQENSSLSLKSNPSKLLRVKRYDNESLVKLTEEFIKEAKDKIDTKFILIISPEIDKYLEWASSERRMHKAQVVREALEGQMHKDKEYVAFLKDMEK